MSLRRLAQTNHAATASPTRPELNPTTSSPASYRTAPSTPRNRISIGAYRSPASTPSISSSIPFDWNAARSRQPPPYATSPQNRARNAQHTGTATSVRRVVRKRGILERIQAIPSRIAFEITLFPHNLPLPAPQTSARLVGGILHLLHLCIRVSQVRKVPDSDLGWEDMYSEGEDVSWLDWTVLVSISLVVASCLNAVYLFTRIRLYRLHQKPEPVSSPNARFVSAQLDFEPLQLPSLASRVRAGAWFAFSYSWRWLLGFRLPSRSAQLPGRVARVQQLEVWTPGQFESILFVVYSPAHAFLWMATGTTNWMTMVAVMTLISAQLHLLTYFYATLLKDKEIIAAEVMHEYNEGFVYPRVNPVRRDVAVMTHQSEVVDVWEGYQNK